MNFIAVPAPAKLNLFLHITGQRADGYHDIQTVFQIIDYHDYLTFTLNPENDIRMITRQLQIPDHENLAYRAAMALKQASQCRLGCDITLDKNLPIGGGLGGGSSNAATTLLALNKLWKLHLSISDLMKIARPLGADVPVFVGGHSAWAEGIGDITTPMILPQRWYLLLTPPCHVSTEFCYQHPKLNRTTPKISPDRYSIGDGHNDFEPVVKAHYKAVSKTMQWLNQYTHARLTGTGSTVFGQFESEAKARHVAQLATKSMNAIVVRGLHQSPAHRCL